MKLDTGLSRNFDIARLHATRWHANTPIETREPFPPRLRCSQLRERWAEGAVGDPPFTYADLEQ